ncbi:MAG: hypothetical protein K9M57_05785 [Phycisphaerae bacterium]|nr:hypothetical protein [Phycisphaerae bacterium]
MKKLVFVFTGMFFLCLVIAPAMAAPTRVTFAGNLVGNANGGGLFLFTSDGTGGLPTEMHTFCMEKNDHISYGGTYWAIDVSNYAWNGGGGVKETTTIGGNIVEADPLDLKSVWLFDQYEVLKNFNGAYNGLNYTNADWANAVQAAIWFNEDESTSIGGLAGDLLADAGNAVAAGYNGNEEIKVLNLSLYSDGRGAVQDQIAYLPKAVPAPGAILLSGIGSIIVGLLRRRNIVE